MNELPLYCRVLFSRIWGRWVTSELMVNLGKLALGFLYSVIIGMYPYVLSITLLVVFDMIFGIKASMKRGEQFSTKKLKRGLLQRIFLYTSLIVCFLMLDVVLHATYDYGKFYIAAIICTLISFYEVSSIMENLIEVYPNFPFLKKIGNVFNLLEKKYEDNTVNQVAKILSNEK